MATIYSSFQAPYQMENASNLLGSGVSLEGAITFVQAAYDNTNYYGIYSYTYTSSTQVSGYLFTGDYVTVYGNNLLYYPYSIYQENYSFNSNGVNVSLYGNINVANSTSYPTGYINKVQVAYNGTTLTINGYDDVTVYGDGTFSSFTYQNGLTTGTVTGSFTGYSWVGTDGYYHASVSGTINTISLSNGYQSFSATGLSTNLSYFLDTTTVDEFMSYALIGNDVLSGSGGKDFLAGYSGSDIFTPYQGNDVILGGSGIDTVVLSGNKKQYAVLPQANGWAIINGPTGLDAVKDVENLQFDNGTYSIANMQLPMQGYMGGVVAIALSSLDMSSTTAWQGNVTYADTSFIRGESADRYQGNFGNFQYDSSGQISGGTINSIVSGTTNTVKGWFSGLNIDVFTYEYFTANNNLQGLYEYACSGNDFIFGSAENDILKSYAGNDYLDGGAGDDVMEGGSGNDIYLINSTNDAVIELFNGGHDTLISKVNSIMAENTETLILLSTQNYSSRTSWTGPGINGTGNNAANLLIGTSAANRLAGGAGDDQIYGGGGNDLIIGGSGNDVLSGGSGSDIFVFDTLSGIDSIKDFTYLDKLWFDDAVFTGLSAGPLADQAFAQGAGRYTALTSDERLIYNTTSGALYYDADGVGGISAVQVAWLMNENAFNTNLNYSQVLIT